MKTGKFITFEGGEGTGKSTQCALLEQSLLQADIPVYRTREPGGTPLAESIRGLLVQGTGNRWDAVTDMLLHTAARRDHVMQVIRPMLEKGTWVICDRYVHSTFAYQGYGHGLDTTYLRMMQRLAVGRVHPCAVFMMDIPVEVGLKRAEARGGKENRYETLGLEFHQRIRDGFLELSREEPHRCQVINADRPIHVIHQEILAEMTKRFGVQLTPQTV